MSLELLAMWSQIVGAIIFVIAVILIWNKYIAPAVKGYQEAKNAEVVEAEARRERMRADVAAARADAERAEADCREITARAEVTAKHEHDKAVEEAKADADRILRNAVDELERARLAARSRLRIEFIEKALAAARTEAPARVSDETNKKLVEKTLADLVRGRG